MARKKSPTAPNLTDGRLLELADTIALGDTYELGPLDRDDIRQALIDLYHIRCAKELADAARRTEVPTPQAAA